MRDRDLGLGIEYWRMDSLLRSDSARETPSPSPPPPGAAASSLEERDVPRRSARRRARRRWRPLLWRRQATVPR